MAAGSLTIKALRALEPLAHSRPGRKAKARRPASGPSAAPARGSGAAGEGLPVRRHLARGSGAALLMPGQHRCYEQAPGRRWRHRFAHPRRCRLAPLGAAHWARQHCARAASTLRAPSAAELNLVDPSTGSGHIGLSARKLHRPLRLGHLRGDPPRLLRCLERPDGQIRGHRLNWNQRLGQGQNLGRLVLCNNADPCMTTIWRDRANSP